MKAFPIPEHTKRDFEYPNQYEGMDLRDYFASKALMSMLSPVQDITESTPNVAARLAYKFADAMMEVRNER
jgi:hypothetical protein